MIAGALQQLDAHLDADELLQRVVVDVVGEPGPLVFLGSHQPLQQMTTLPVDPLELSDRLAELLGAFGDRDLELRVVRHDLALQRLDLGKLRRALLHQPRVVQGEGRVRGELAQQHSSAAPHRAARRGVLRATIMPSR